MNEEASSQNTISDADPAIADLRALVQRYRVGWRVFPEELYVDGERRKIGFDLELGGAHSAEVTHPIPGCEHCLQVYSALHRIAEWLVRQEASRARFEISLFDQALHFDPARNRHPEVELTVQILHRGQWDAPIDEAEKSCLQEMEEQLNALGARRR